MEQHNLDPLDDLDFTNEPQILLAIERTRLANERTFLSWIRTAIGFIGGGVAMEKFINFNNESDQMIAKISGDILIVIGILFLVFALINFLYLKKQLTVKSKIIQPVTYFITAVTVVLIILSLILLFILI